MNEHDTAVILRTAAAAWPHPAWTPETLALWTAHLAPLEFGPAWEALEHLVGSAKFPPRWAGFAEHYRAKLPRTAGLPELEGPPPAGRSAARFWLDELAADLDTFGAEARRANPQHTSPNPASCAVCSDRRTRYEAQR